MFSIDARIDSVALDKQLASMIERLGEPYVRRFLKRSGALMRISVRKNFSAGGRPSSWAPLKTSTLQRYAYAKTGSGGDKKKFRFTEDNAKHFRNLQKRRYRVKALGSSKRRKQARRRKPLLASRRLRNSVGYWVKSDWGASADYVDVGVHPNIRATWKPARYLAVGTPKMVARPYVLFQAEDIRNIDGLGGEFIDNAVGIRPMTRVTSARFRPGGL